jgi:hypothetical protein
LASYATGDVIEKEETQDDETLGACRLIQEGCESEKLGRSSTSPGSNGHPGVPPEALAADRNKIFCGSTAAAETVDSSICKVVAL